MHNQQIVSTCLLHGDEGMEHKDVVLMQMTTGAT